jgi:hypothetical protein
MALPALLTPILLGTAAFGIAKLAGASTKTAILAGLGTFGGTAALGAINPTMYGSIFGTESAKSIYTSRSYWNKSRLYGRRHNTCW